MTAPKKRSSPKKVPPRSPQSMGVKRAFEETSTPCEAALFPTITYPTKAFFVQIRNNGKQHEQRQPVGQYHTLRLARKHTEYRMSRHVVNLLIMYR